MQDHSTPQGVQIEAPIPEPLTKQRGWLSKNLTKASVLQHRLFKKFQKKLNTDLTVIDIMLPEAIFIVEI